MANIVSTRTVRKGTKTKTFVIEKFGDGYGVGRYRYGGLSSGWKPFEYLRDARVHLEKLVRKEKGLYYSRSLRKYVTIPE